MANSQIEQEKWKQKFQQDRYQEAISEALSNLQHDDSMWKWIIKNYSEPLQEKRCELCKNNIKYLEEYKYFFGQKKSDDVQIIWFDYRKYLVFQTCVKISVCVWEMDWDIQNYTDKIVILADCIDIHQILEYKKITEYHGERPNYKNPLYLYFSQEVFDALIYCFDFSQLLEDERVVIMVGEKNLKFFFDDFQAVMPDGIISARENKKVVKILTDIIAEKTKRLNDNKMEAEETYKNKRAEINQRIKERKPKVMILTSYFTTALQYHARDCQKSLESLGVHTLLYMEKGEIFNTTLDEFYLLLNKFQPDVIFLLDHFRFDEPEVSEDIVFVSWIQDTLPDIMNPNTKDKLGKRDFILNHFTTWKTFHKLGYNEKKILDAPIPANFQIYKPYQLSEEEYNTFSCDICLMSHAADISEYIEDKVRLVPDIIKEPIRSIYQGYVEYVYQSEHFFYSKEEFALFIDGVMKQIYQLELKESVIEKIAADMHILFSHRVFRQVIADWLIDAGYTNLKLWGNDWKKIDKYKNFAMGPAENGETLSKILQSSKIVLGCNMNVTAAARAWETMLSGGFYMCNYVPEEEDAVDIRKIMTEDDNLVMFYDKQDLLTKIDYYLTHEEERIKMAEKGRKVALEKMTYDVLMKKMLDFLGEKIDEMEYE